MKNTEKFKDTIINALETLKKNNYIKLDLLSDKVQIINKNVEEWYEPQILDFLIVFGLIPVLNRTKSF